MTIYSRSDEEVHTIDATACAPANFSESMYQNDQNYVLKGESTYYTRYTKFKLILRLFKDHCQSLFLEKLADIGQRIISLGVEFSGKSYSNHLYSYAKKVYRSMSHSLMQ